jgi:hypothetical protein
LRGNGRRCGDGFPLSPASARAGAGTTAFPASLAFAGAGAVTGLSLMRMGVPVGRHPARGLTGATLVASLAQDLDLAKSTLDFSKSTLDFGKSTLNFGKSTLDFGKSTVELAGCTVDLTKRTVDLAECTSAWGWIPAFPRFREGRRGRWP